MKKYYIEVSTNDYIASRDAMFNGKNYVVLESNLTLKEAREMLLDLYNSKFDGERSYAANWGLAVIQSRKYVDGAIPTFSDGTRSFDWDSRIYSIEKHEN